MSDGDACAGMAYSPAFSAPACAAHADVERKELRIDDGARAEKLLRDRGDAFARLDEDGRLVRRRSRRRIIRDVPLIGAEAERNQQDQEEKRTHGDTRPRPAS